MRAILTLGAALLTVSSPTFAEDLLLRRPDGRYERGQVPNARARKRLARRPVPGANGAAVHDSRGR